jgi:hypothetical protein
VRDALRVIAALIAIWIAIFLVYRITERRLKIIDVQAVIRLPISLWNEGNLNVDEFTGIPQGRGLTKEHDGHMVSVFPFWPSLQIFPVYACYGAFGRMPTEETVWTVQRRASQVSMALTATLIALLVAHRFNRQVAFLTATAFAFGTINWFVLSQLAFSNGLVQLWVAGALVVGVWRLPPSPRAATFSLMLLVVATFFRLNLIVFALAWATYLVLRLQRHSLWPLASALALALTMAAANTAYMGHPLGLYAIQASKLGLLSPSFWTALYGNLLSPARGLLVFSPWLIFGGLAFIARNREERLAFTAILAGCVAHYLLTCNYPRWQGGGSMGPRLTADLLPAWSLLAASGFAWCFQRRWLTGVAVALVGFSCIIAGGHAFSNSHLWEHVPVTTDIAPDRLFDWRDALVLEPFRRSSHEDRYPIHLLEPGPDSTVATPTLRLSWAPGASPGLTPEVDLSFRHRPRGVRIGLVTLAAVADDHLLVDAAALPSTFDPTRPVAWRVRLVDERGNTRSQSGWRQLRWCPPPVTAPEKP